MSDPLADIVSLLNPKPSHSKFVEASGQWHVARESGGEAFYCAVLQGECLISVDNQSSKKLAAGDFILIPAAHSFRNTNVTHHPLHNITIPTVKGKGHIRLGDNEGPAELLMHVGHCQFDTPDKQLIVSLLPKEILIKGQQRIVTLVELLRDESRTQRPGRDVVMKQLLQLLLIESLRNDQQISQPSGVLRGLQHPKISTALHLIHESPGADWQIAQLAMQVAMSRSSFFATFNDVVGIPPMQYLLFWRMSLGKNALMTGNEKIEQIAFQIGYKSASAFSVAFTKYVGVAPSEFRRQCVPFADQEDDEE